MANLRFRLINRRLSGNESLHGLRETCLLMTTGARKLHERNTSIIEIRYFAETAEEAASIANEIARVYEHSLKSAATAAGVSLIKISIVDPATPGLRPVRPNKPVNLAIGALAGLLLGTAAGAGVAGHKSAKESPAP